MKRLSSTNIALAGLVNSAVLNHYNLKCNPKYDLNEIPHILAYAIQQALKHAVKKRFNEANKRQIDEFVYMVTRYIMRIPSEALPPLRGDEGDWYRWIRIVQYQRRLLVELHSSYGLPIEPQQIIVTEQLIRKMEEIFFAETDDDAERAIK